MVSIYFQEITFLSSVLKLQVYMYYMYYVYYEYLYVIYMYPDLSLSIYIYIMYIYISTYIYVYRQIDRQIDRQIGRQIERQIDRWIDNKKKCSKMLKFSFHSFEFFVNICLLLTILFFVIYRSTRAAQNLVNFIN